MCTCRYMYQNFPFPSRSGNAALSSGFFSLIRRCILPAAPHLSLRLRKYDLGFSTYKECLPVLDLSNPTFIFCTSCASFTCVNHCVNKLRSVYAWSPLHVDEAAVAQRDSHLCCVGVRMRINSLLSQHQCNAWSNNSFRAQTRHTRYERTLTGTYRCPSIYLYLVNAEIRPRLVRESVKPKCLDLFVHPAQLVSSQRDAREKDVKRKRSLQQGDFKRIQSCTWSLFVRSTNHQSSASSHGSRLGGFRFCRLRR
ncbi:hypothetical protein TGVAND_231992 [Toxoplasma gondii VAND]|uniref:Uncharacterized protein n=1 Tax=Toxoplasma gondii VAND TaxID=933077 RepID=A0A086QF13_TOXGO|nr:hypothetical protein TGVAND_231992 [Toxoplasma gondii VAND]